MSFDRHSSREEKESVKGHSTPRKSFCFNPLFKAQEYPVEKHVSYSPGTQEEVQKVNKIHSSPSSKAGGAMALPFLSIFL